MDSPETAFSLGIGTTLGAVVINYLIIKKLWPDKEQTSPKHIGLRWALCLWAVASLLPISNIIEYLFIGGDLERPIVMLISGIVWCVIAFGLGYLWGWFRIGKATVTAVSTVSQTIKDTTESFSAKDSVWWYAINGERKGTVSREDLKNLFVQGQITPETLVWKEGMGNWEKIADISAFSGILSSAPPPLLNPNSPPTLPNSVVEDEVSTENTQHINVAYKNNKKNNFFLITILTLTIMSLSAFGIINSEQRTIPDQLSLATNYFLGIGNGNTQISYEDALEALYKSLEKDDKNVITMHLAYENGRIFDEDFKKAIPLLIQLADKGSSEAQTELGQVFGMGLTVPKNIELAKSYYLRAAEQGDWGAQGVLASLYLHAGQYQAAYIWQSIQLETISEEKKQLRTKNTSEAAQKSSTELFELMTKGGLSFKESLKKLLTKSQLNNANAQVEKWKVDHPKQFNNQPPHAQ